MFCQPDQSQVCTTERARGANGPRTEPWTEGGRLLSIQHVAEWVGNIATAKEEDREYEMPALKSPIATIVVSLDGAMVPMADSPGYREAMVGALSFYDGEGDRQHTIYLLVLMTLYGGRTLSD
jgi:hypothetical protein